MLKFITRHIHPISKWTLLVSSALFVLCLIAGIVIIVSHWFKIESYGQLGDFLGGVFGSIFALVGTILLLLTFREQRRQHQRDVFESTFNEMLNLHKQNVNEIEITTIDGNATLKGRSAFPQMVEEYTSLFQIVQEIANQIIQRFPYKYQTWSTTIDGIELCHHLAFGFFFYDVDNYRITRDRNNILFDFTKDLVIELKKQERSKSYLQLQRNRVLSHYYRHLYNMVKYIDNSSKIISFKDRELHCNLIRSQMSDFEQVMLYYDTLSVLGINWIQPLGANNIDGMCLLCKYRMIKNLPCYFSYCGKDPGLVFKIEDETWRSRGEKFFETDIRF